jgi:tetratricopeptide (TPR) repeat protein
MAEGSAAATSLLQGQKIAFIGAFADWSLLVDLIQTHGGQLVPTITSLTTLLIVGQERWPITKEGKLSSKVLRARRFQAKGSLTILTENEILDRLGHERAPLGSCDLSISQLSQLLKVSEARLRRWVQGELLEPAGSAAGDHQFNFQQVKWAKDLRDICKAGVSLRRIRRSLARLKQWLPGMGLNHAEQGVMEQDGQLLVRLEDGRLADSKGQRVFDFGQNMGEITLDLNYKPISADDYFHNGRDREEAGDLAEAAEAYKQALKLGGPDATTCFNLANVLFEMGQPEQAVEYYRRAVEINPSFTEAWNNLGNAFMKLAQAKRAVDAFHKALACDPAYWDGHYNLAEAYDQLGCYQEARAHWRLYAQNDATSPWGQYARRRLRDA